MVALALLVGCGSASPRAVVLARGTLAYAAAAVEDRIVTVELAERFELIVRSWDGHTATERLRVDLGPPEADVVALAVAGDHAWVGGRDGWITGLGLGDGARQARWPQGAPIAALGADRDHVVSADRDGVACVRTIADGALRVCADVGTPPRTLSLDGDHVWFDDTRRRLADLAEVAGVAAPARTFAVDGPEVRWRDATGVARAQRMAAPIRAVVAGPDGAVLIAAWVADLDDPSVLLRWP